MKTAVPSLTVSDPAEAGLDARQLARVPEYLREHYIESGKLAGCQVLVHRLGHNALLKSVGAMELGGSPVREDAIWRIFSMTKPVTSVALMTLYEKGLFQLRDPVERFLPGWANLQVSEVDDDGNERLVEPARPMNVRDLLTHTSGLTYGGDAAHPVGRRYRDAGLLARDYNLEEFARRLSELPLMFHPGERWHYSVATDVCGYLVEVLSGRPFDEYLREEIFEPLGMVDTAFGVPESELDRVPVLYRRTEEKDIDPIEWSGLHEPPQFKSGGGGLRSTTADYLRFCRMLLGGGSLDSVRILGPKTLDFMTQNHLPGGADLGQVALGAFGETQFPGIGFGLGFAVSLGPARTGVIGSAGEYRWGGAASTIFWVDPQEEMIVIFMTQLMPSTTYNIRSQLAALIYPAIVD